MEEIARNLKQRKHSVIALEKQLVSIIGRPLKSRIILDKYEINDKPWRRKKYLSKRYVSIILFINCCKGDIKGLLCFFYKHKITQQIVKIFLEIIDEFLDSIIFHVYITAILVK